MVWYQVQPLKLAVFGRQLHHAQATGIVKMVSFACKANAKHDVSQTKNVIATNAVKVERVNHFAAETMIVDTAKCVKISFVQLDVDQMLTVQVIWLA